MSQRDKDTRAVENKSGEKNCGHVPFKFGVRRRMTVEKNVTQNSDTKVIKLIPNHLIKSAIFLGAFYVTDEIRFVESERLPSS